MLKSEWSVSGFEWDEIDDLKTELVFKVKDSDSTVYSLKWDSPTIGELLKFLMTAIKTWWKSR